MRVSKDYYRRRRGLRLTVSSLKMKAYFLRTGFISFTDFIVSGFGQAFVSIMPASFTEWFYKTFLRK
ncbi:MAG: hypothetical protein IJR63_11905 [Synergistaceae bacterium]|nr:hypothetical protein [Synergistaceae bacterium]